MARLGIDGDTLEVSPYTTGDTGTQLDPVCLSSQTVVTLGGIPVLVQGDFVAGHVLWGTGTFGGAIITDSHTNNTLVSSQTFVTINGIPVIMNGDRSSCAPGHTLTASTTFTDIS